VIYARGTVEEWLMAPQFYKEEVSIYRKFNQTIKENENEKD
jgi:hypothetical protein